MYIGASCDERTILYKSGALANLFLLGVERGAKCYRSALSRILFTNPYQLLL